MPVRPFDIDRDLEQVRDCAMELQDYEARIDARMPSGAQIADRYLTGLLQRCEEEQGTILVAEADGQVVGYTTVLTRVKSEELDEGDYDFGLVADLVVRERWRGRGFGKALLEAAEDYAAGQAVSWLRIGVMAENRSAWTLYASLGFVERLVELEKPLGRRQ